MRKEIIGDAVLYLGDCIDVMRTMPDNSVDSIVTDPPYELGFMGKGWDRSGIANSVEMWREALRVLKPGGHLLAFSGSRTYHRMTSAMEDAGFDVRDQSMWLYGSGFPKSHDVSKAIDKAAGADRERVAGPKSGGMAALNKGNAAHGYRDTAYYDNGNMMLSNKPATDDAHQWQGWGTALKPAHEPVCVARKPFKGTVAANVLEHGTGALNIDGCRVATDENLNGGAYCDGNKRAEDASSYVTGTKAGEFVQPSGRWPANVIHDGSDEVLAAFPVTTSGGGNKSGKKEGGVCYGKYGAPEPDVREADSGSAARFFYCAKASKKDREEGLEHLDAVHRPNGNKWTDQDYRVARGERPPSAESGPRRNTHPTVKPTDLMRYLVRLITPPGGTVMDPFMGSGSTGKAAASEGFRFIGIDMTPEYIEIARARIAAAVPANDNRTTDAQRQGSMF